MSVGKAFGDAWTKISGDPGIVAGAVQILAALVSIIISTMTKTPPSRPSS
jgi:hypothetical protein